MSSSFLISFCHIICFIFFVSLVVTVLNKSWCIEHFNCTACDSLLSSRFYYNDNNNNCYYFFIIRGGAKYIDMDERPYCKKCFDKIPVELRRRLKKQSD